MSCKHFHPCPFKLKKIIKTKYYTYMEMYVEICTYANQPLHYSLPVLELDPFFMAYYIH